MSKATRKHKKADGLKMWAEARFVLSIRIEEVGRTGFQPTMSYPTQSREQAVQKGIEYLRKYARLNPD
jgi:hypothetical protein